MPTIVQWRRCWLNCGLEDSFLAVIGDASGGAQDGGASGGDRGHPVSYRAD